MMKDSSLGKRLLQGISPGIIVGALVVLLPIFIFLALDNINKQKEQTIRLLTEKGAALIRSFEAGARTGAGMHWGVFQLQKLLVETAQQPDIDYLIVTDEQGVILADSDPSMVGERHGTNLNLVHIAQSKSVAWRQVQNSVGADTFEVFRGFAPTEDGFGGFRQEARSGRIKHEEKNDRYVIFVGLNMESIEAARVQDMHHTIWMAAIFLLAGFFGIASLFLAQGYRTTRVSLSRIQAFSDSLVENMPIGIIAVDGDNRIASYNQAAETILGYQTLEILGRKAEDVLPVPCQAILETMKSQEAVVEKEIECPTRDGRTTPLEILGTPLRDDDGNLIAYVVLLRDLTEVNYLKREVARSQRLASLGRLAAGVAHEIRNPLSSIKGFATYFRERYRDNAQDAGTAEIMIQEVERLNRVISQLLEFARPLQVTLQDVSLPSIIRHTLKMIEGQAREHRIDIRTDLPEDMEPITADPDKLKQVFLNLYLNGMTAMENGGTLTVSAAREEHHTVRVDITDTGRGIPAEDLGRIFDPYFTTKPTGTGLGLAIVYKVVEAHGGEIRVTSAVGSGTTVSIYLPTMKKDR
jgi:two-component system, NtrC family, sensor histidine kinase HydH